jgi:hypothetical protein
MRVSCAALCCQQAGHAVLATALTACGLCAACAPTPPRATPSPFLRHLTRCLVAHLAPTSQIEQCRRRVGQRCEPAQALPECASPAHHFAVLAAARQDVLQGPSKLCTQNAFLFWPLTGHTPKRPLTPHLRHQTHMLFTRVRDVPALNPATCCWGGTTVVRAQATGLSSLA